MTRAPKFIGENRRPWIFAIVAFCVLLMLADTGRQMWRDTKSPSKNGDVKLYARVSGDLARGGLPYRDFQVEYPPTVPYALAIPAGFSEPGSLTSYVPKFILFMGLVAVGGLVGLVGYARKLGSPWMPLMVASVATAFAFLAMNNFVVRRYDILPAVIFAFGIALFARHWRAPSLAAAAGAGALIAGSASLKLYGIFALFGLGALLLDRKSSRGFGPYALGAGLALLPSVVLALLGPAGLKYFLGYHGERHVEIGSLYATVITALPGNAEEAIANFGSIELRHPTERTFMALGSVLCVVLAVAPIVVMALRNRRERLSLETVLFGVALSLAGFVIFNKVFSPQYAIWTLVLAPLFGLAERRRGLAAIGAVTAMCIGCGWQMFGNNFMRPELEDTMRIINGKNVVCLVAYGVLAWCFAGALRSNRIVEASERATQPG